MHKRVDCRNKNVVLWQNLIKIISSKHKHYRVQSAIVISGLAIEFSIVHIIFVILKTDVCYDNSLV